MYGRAEGRLEGRGPGRLLELIELGNTALHNGDTLIDSNRLCLDAYAQAYIPSVVGGYGSCDPTTTASVTITNNIIEGRAENTSGFKFYGCENNLQVVATNNTVLSTSSAVGGLNDGTSMSGVQTGAYWRVTNNVFAGLGSRERAFDLSAVSRILSAEGNLVFGYPGNAPSPTPSMTNSNDFSGTATLANTFVNSMSGDFRPLPTGQAVIGGVNVWRNSTYGGVTGDLHQQGRPDAGTW